MEKFDITSAASGGEVVAEAVEIAAVWAGHPVLFALLTHGPLQTVAYYDESRRLTVAQRALGRSDWAYSVLPEAVEWDSHNEIFLAADDDGCLHLSGNMHGVPLVYFRTAVPGDIRTFERVPSMVGRNEDSVTYPEFFRGPGGALLFAYRDGYSGRGDQIYNVYDHVSRSWRRLLDTPFTDGQGERNAYLSGPTPGPDGDFHIVWVWRETPDAATNHDPSYARSRDLVHWERSDGTPCPLPITQATGEVVTPIPAGDGVINGNVFLGFDSHHRPIISYTRYDAAGNTQIHLARREGDGWQITQVSAWDWRWDFGGPGTIIPELQVFPVRLSDHGELTLSYVTRSHGSGVWTLDEETLRPSAHRPGRPDDPAGLGRVESEWPGMQVNWVGDSGSSTTPGLRYALRWETLGQNRDHPRPEPLPPPSPLRLVALRTV